MFYYMAILSDSDPYKLSPMLNKKNITRELTSRKYMHNIIIFVKPINFQ